MSETIIQATIDEKTKAEAAAVLSEMGFSISDVIQAAIHQIAVEKRLPPGIHLEQERACPHSHHPNALTRATLDKSERGEEVHMAKDADDLFRQLGLDDA